MEYPSLTGSSTCIQHYGLSAVVDFDVTYRVMIRYSVYVKQWKIHGQCTSLNIYDKYSRQVKPAIAEVKCV
jgi:hypothetical protein